MKILMFAMTAAMTMVSLAGGWTPKSGVAVKAAGEGATLGYAADETVRLLTAAGVKNVAKAADGAANGVFSLRIGEIAGCPEVGGVKADGFAIKVDEKGVAIAAKSAKGVLNGVYTLAEEAGFAFLFPGEQGEIVPAAWKEIAEGTRVVNPRFPYRGLFMSSKIDDRQYNLVEWLSFLAKIRFNAVCYHGAAHGTGDLMRKLGLRAETGGHGMSSCLPRDLFDKEPELFRMFQPEDFDGKRMKDSNFCISNPKTQKIVEKNFTERIREHAANGYYAVHAWADDLPGGGWCMCSRCRSLDGSDQSQLAMNIEARAIRNAGFEMRVPAIAYHDTMFPSSAIAPDPLCFLLFAPRERCYAHGLGDPRCERNSIYLKALREWQKVYARNTDPHTFEYYNDKILFRGHTPYLPDVILGDADVYERHGIESWMSLQVGGPLIAVDWNMIAHARVAWEKGLTRGQLTAELVRAFPKAEQTIWTKYLEKRADAYESAWRVCDLPYTIYFDYRFMPERGGSVGKQLVADIAAGQADLDEAAKALAAASGKLTGKGAALAGLEIARLKPECIDLAAMVNHQEGLYEIGEWRSDGDLARVKKALGHFETTVSLLEKAAVEFEPIAPKSYYAAFARAWSGKEIKEKIRVYGQALEK